MNGVHRLLPYPNSRFVSKVISMQRPLYASRLLIVFAVLFGGGHFDASGAGTASQVETRGSVQVDESSPVVLGYGVGTFRVGESLAKDNFQSLDDWVVQIEDRQGFPEASVRANDGTLDCLVPGRGCTVWYRDKLPTRIAITYDVVCPTHEPAIRGVEPRDLNQFWMATDPADPEKGLFDESRYSGKFTDYDKMHGYYASSGGRKNTTTRMRRYPRSKNGKPVPHVALNEQDNHPGYLIQPNRKMTVQLVAFDDVVQYILDGKLVYQFRQGDSVELEDRDAAGKIVQRMTQLGPEGGVAYREGFFGFRMVATHHVYSNFRVHELLPIESEETSAGRPVVRVDSIEGLRRAAKESGQQIVMTPGEYFIADRKGLRFSGSDNDVELTGVKLNVPIVVASGRNLFRLSGDGITIRGGFVEDTYPDGSTEVTDFGSYNQGRKYGGMNEMVIPGDNNRVIGMKMIVRGSYPYGYGNMYGIGAGSVLGLRKHCGIQITGDNVVIDGCQIKMEAFGHAIYVQGGNRTTVRNTIVEGMLRPSNDCYEERNERDLAKRFDYQLQWPEDVRGLPIPRDHMINCTEDGIRAYKGAGEMVVDNCVVKKARGGIKLYMAKKATVTNCQVFDCVVQGFSLPHRGVIENCRGNAAYGPLLYVHSDSHSGQQIDLEVLPAPHSLGDHPLAALKGKGHDIRLWQRSPAEETLRPIIVGYALRFDFLSVDFPDVPKGHEALFEKHAPKTYRASDITLTNETQHPIVLAELSSGNHVSSLGPVTDLGIDNELKTITHTDNAKDTP
ncbi:MAG: right-handed parallel beta-helix repeat-containing protein [Rhodopirellula sp. JB055]|uniref:right-handed parallel beta-helix repeat-containing protein n=1 Tax=Rhodopirellula sp. JB055 TaxID=3342846 RepID=UPI00370C4112